MNKKLVYAGVIVCMLVLTGAFTATATSVKLLESKKSERILSTNNVGSIQTVTEVEKIDDRTCDIKIYAYNPSDEDVTIKIAPASVVSGIFIGESQVAYYTMGPTDSWLVRFLFNFLGTRGSFTIAEVIPSHDKTLLYDYTFEGISNMPLIYRISWGVPKVLPAGEYSLISYIVYEYNGEIETTQSDSVIITLGQ